MINSGVLNIENTTVNYRDLVEKAKTGETAALTDLYNEFFERIFRFIFFRVGHKESAEDLTEDVFIKAFTKLPGLKDSDLFSAWLYQIARNKIIDHYRKNVTDVALEEVENVLEYTDGIADLIDQSKDKDLIIECLKELPKDQRLVIEMKFFEDLDNVTIAELLNKTEGAVRVIQHRALTKLKELLNGQ